MGGLRKATKYLSVCQLSGPIFEPGASRVRSRTANHLVVKVPSSGVCIFVVVET
jgi:hypothetical protein